METKPFPPSKGQPIVSGDIFITPDGHSTLPFPKLSKRGNGSIAQKQQDEWLLKSAARVAQKRGNLFAAQTFLMDMELSGDIPDGSIAGAHDYLASVPEAVSRHPLDSWSL